jgi:ubiquinone/menaquinone biosynthesis C-methylase UbiE
MLAETRQNLPQTEGTFRFGLADIRSIPFGDGLFDAVIANHMLYYVPDKPQAFREVIRVLKPAGRFYTTTVGENHMADLGELVRRFDARDTSFDFDSRNLDFLLETGQPQLGPFFNDIRLDRYEDSLEITAVEPLINYIFSGRFKESVKDREAEFRRFLDYEMGRLGVIRIHKSGILLFRG